MLFSKRNASVNIHSCINWRILNIKEKNRISLQKHANLNAASKYEIAMPQKRQNINARTKSDELQPTSKVILDKGLSYKICRRHETFLTYSKEELPRVCLPTLERR